MPRGYWFSSTRTRRWTCGRRQSISGRSGSGQGRLAPARGPPAAHLLLGDAIDDVLHGFVGVAGEDPLQADGALPQRFPHTDVQVVVGLLGCQVLRERWPRSAPRRVLVPRCASTAGDTEPWGCTGQICACTCVSQPRGWVGTGRLEHPTNAMQGATLVSARANAHDTHNDIEPGVEADHLPCKERQAEERALGTTCRDPSAPQGAA